MDLSEDVLHIEAEIARAWTLPASLYTDPSILVAEREKIFARTRPAAGHARGREPRRLFHHGPSSFWGKCALYALALLMSHGDLGYCHQG